MIYFHSTILTGAGRCGQLLVAFSLALGAWASTPHVGVADAKEISPTTELDPNQIRKLAESDDFSVTQSPPEHLRLDPMFAEFPDLFRGPDIEFDSQSDIEKRRDLGYRAQLELGMQHRRAGEYDFAVRALIKLLEKHPPESYRRQAMLQLALIAELREDWIKAQQIYRHYESLYPKDPNIPLVTLRLGEIYREIGAEELALSNFHSIIMMSVKSPGVNGKYFPLYRRIVLKAKTEIANTYMGRGEYETAARHYRMLISDDGDDDPMGRINLPSVRYKLCRCLSRLELHSELEREVERFLDEHPGHELEADIRYLAVQSLQARQKSAEVLDQFEEILRIPVSSGEGASPSSEHWKTRIGLEVASQMVQAGDYLDSLKVYRALLGFVTEIEDEITIRYQMGLVFERLHQPAQAMAAYRKIQGRMGAPADAPAESPERLIADMTEWRIGMLDWFRKKQLVLEGMKDDNLSRSGTSDE